MQFKKQKSFTRFVLSLSAVAIVGLLACSQSFGGKSSTSGVFFEKKEGPNGKVAKVFGQEVSAEDLERAIPDAFGARMELYNAQKAALEEFIRQKTFEELAKKEKITVAEFEGKLKDRSKKEIGDKEVNAFLKDRVSDMSKVPPHIREQVKTILYAKELVEGYTKKNPVDLYLKRPTAPKLDFNFAGAAAWGKEDAPVTIVEFSDFQCPFCSKGADRVAELKKKYGKKIRVVFKHFPLPNHHEARPAAEASLCVNEQSADKFWKFHDNLFANQKDWSEEDYIAIAKDAGVDAKKFEDCLKAKKYAAQVEADIAEGNKFGVNSTPSFFVNNQPIKGARDIGDFAELIDDALAK